MQGRNQLYYALSTYGALCAGIILGTLIILISVCLNCDFFTDKGLEDYGFSMVMNLPTSKLLFFIVKRRCFQCILIAFLFRFLLPNHASAILCMCFGIYYGIIIADLILKYSVCGLLYGFVCFFPHYYFYFLSIYLLTKWKIQSLNDCYEYMNWKVRIVKFFVIFVLFCLSMTWEIRFQKNFLNYFFQYIV